MLAAIMEAYLNDTLMILDAYLIRLKPIHQTFTALVTFEKGVCGLMHAHYIQQKDLLTSPKPPFDLILCNFNIKSNCRQLLTFNESPSPSFCFFN